MAGERQCAARIVRAHRVKLGNSRGMLCLRVLGYALALFAFAAGLQAQVLPVGTRFVMSHFKADGGGGDERLYMLRIAANAEITRRCCVDLSSRHPSACWDLGEPGYRSFHPLRSQRALG